MITVSNQHFFIKKEPFPTTRDHLARSIPSMKWLSVIAEGRLLR
jgi:hypothetical protein